MSHLRASLTCSGVFAVLAFAGCLPPAEPVSSGGATTTPGIVCMEVMNCFTSCADDPCIGECRARGSETAQQRVTALLDCTTNVCQNDSDCVGTSCRAEIDACQADSAVATGGATQPVAAGGPQPGHATEGLLEWMTGEWIGTRSQFTFHADGRVRRASGVALYTDKGTYGCASLVNDEGTVRQEGDLLIMTFQTSDTNHCGTKESVEPVTVRYRIEWYDNPYDQDPNMQLVLRDIDCTKGDDMYCIDRLTRR